MSDSSHLACIKILRGENVKANEGGTIRYRCIAEFWGTFFLVFFGTGSVANAVFSGALSGLWQVAMIWGFGLAIAIYSTASVSGAHLNPAVSLSLAILRPNDFPWRYFPYYLMAQFTGAFVASVLILITFNGSIRDHENKFNYSKGDDCSILAATAFGEYFPNPNFRFYLEKGTDGACQLLTGGLEWEQSATTAIDAFFIEVVCTSILVFFIFSYTDERNKVLVGSKDMAPFFIGFTVAVLIGCFAQFTQGCMNPARDFGPRLVAAAAGYGEVAIPGPQGNEVWIYLLAPMIGGPIGGFAYEFYGRGLRPETKQGRIKGLYTFTPAK